MLKGKRYCSGGGRGMRGFSELTYATESLDGFGGGAGGTSGTLYDVIIGEYVSLVGLQVRWFSEKGMDHGFLWLH